MEIKNFLNDGLKFINSAGALQTQIDVYNYYLSGTNTSGLYDDEITQTKTGSFSFSGLVFPMSSKFGSEEALLLQQGKVLLQDKVLYCGSVSLEGSGLVFKINNQYYNLIENGIHTYSVTGSTIYNKIYIRYNTGSILW